MLADSIPESLKVELVPDSLYNIRMKSTGVKRVQETAIFGIGFLLGGFAGLGIGSLFHSEQAVVIGYVVGAIIGAWGLAFLARIFLNSGKG